MYFHKTPFSGAGGYFVNLPKMKDWFGHGAFKSVLSILDPGS